MMERKPRLHGRAAAVFEKYLGGQENLLHPEDRQAAEEFWTSLGKLDAPSYNEPLPARPTRKVLAAVMASVALIAVAVTVVSDTGNDPVSDASETYITERSQTSAIVLPDGSTVRLGANSAIQTQMSANERRITLTAGEAIFDVRHDAGRPFVVATRSGEVMALGTTFMVRLLPSQTTLTVIEGSVKVTPAAIGSRVAGLSRVAGPGQQVGFGINDSDPQHHAQAFVGNVEKADVSKATGWTRGMLYFKGEPLTDVISVVNRYARVPLPPIDPAIGDMPVYAAIRQGDTSAIQALIDDPGGAVAASEDVRAE